MASKKNNNILGLLAFIAMFINFVYWLICIINNQGWITINGKLISIMLFVATCLLTAVVLIVAYGWAKAQTKVWYILFWVFAIISICAIVLGLGSNLAN